MTATAVRAPGQQGIELPRLWKPLRYHKTQQQFLRESARFCTLAKGRRSGGTELVLRRGIMRGLIQPLVHGITDWWTVFGAPTREQAKRVYWNKLRGMIPRKFVRETNKTELSLTLHTGAKFQVLGMDEPARVEGAPLDDFNGDEYGNMKKEVWDEHVRACLSTPGRRPGTATLFGTPEGMNHFYDLCKQGMDPDNTDWVFYTWTSEGVVPDEELASARRTLDPLVFDQEYGATFQNFTGRAYYNYDTDVHARYPVRSLYDPTAPLYFNFDFNTAPGVCEVGQFARPEKFHDPIHAEVVRAFFGEVWIPRASNSQLVARRAANDWKDHKGDIVLDGDATGGIKTTQSLVGDDWEIIEDEMAQVFGHGRIRRQTYLPNPYERQRVNAVNSGLLGRDGLIRTLIDRGRCPHLDDDFCRVQVVEGGSGELLKEKGSPLTHPSDSVGYWMARDPIEEPQGRKRDAAFDPVY